MGHWRNWALVLAAGVAASSGGHAQAAPKAAKTQAAVAPDAIYYNGKVLTVDPAFRIVQAFAVTGERFSAVGNDAQLRKLAGKHTRLIDLHGATVIPGFTDSHDHLWNSARFEFEGVNLIGVTSLAELQQRLRAALATQPAGQALFTSLGWAVDPAPTRQDLDAVSGSVPIALLSNRHGGGLLNSAALHRLGIDKANPLFRGEKVPVDKDGEPTGMLPGYPLGLTVVTALLPPLTAAQEDDFVRKAMAERNRLGITSIRELAIWPNGVAALQRMRREGKLTVRMALGLEFPDQAATGVELAKLPKPDRKDPWLFLDSAGEEPWVPGTMQLDDYIPLLRREQALGWRPAPHVNADKARGAGYDQALEQALAAYEAIDKDKPIGGQRWYVEHAPFATPQQMDRMARLGVIVSVQDSGYEPLSPAPFGADRMSHQNPLRSLLDHHIMVIAGSDYRTPTKDDATPNDPMKFFTFYVTRRNRAGEAPTSAERISRQEALRILTVNPAYATFQEKQKGQVATGMLADFVILNQDLMTVSEDRLAGTHPVATFVGGRRVFAEPAGPF